MHNGISDSSRTGTFDFHDNEKHKTNNRQFDNAKFEKNDAVFQRQLTWQFQKTATTTNDRVNAMGLGVRYSATTDLLMDDDARMAQTTYIKRLPRCHWED